MAEQSDLYARRIGRPRTSDEVRGYWLFVVGLLAGIAGMLLFLPSEPASPLRQWSIVFGAAGLALLIAGPVVRLPLRSTATLVTRVGLLVCGAAIVWFVVAFPADWSVQTGNAGVIGLYALGLAIIAVGGVVIPLLTEATADVDDRAAGLERDLAAEREGREAGEREHAAEREAGEREHATEREADEREHAAEREADEREHAAEREADERKHAAEREADAARHDEVREASGAAAEAAAAEREQLEAELAALRASQGRFELYEDAGGKWRWRLRHRNGNVTATSGQGYTRKYNAQKGLHGVRRDALGATIVLVESEADLPEADEPFDPVAERESRARFEVVADKRGDHRWRLVHENGNLIADSGQGYASRDGAQEAVERVREYVGPADYLWFDPAGFEVYRDRGGAYRWRLVHRNGNILADGGEGYSRRHDARRAVDRLRERVDDLEFEVYEDAGGEYRWRLRSGGDVVADSGEGYASRDGAEEAVERVTRLAPEADTLEMGRAAFEIYEDRGDEHRWRLRHRNGNILADSGEGYASRSGARDGVESVKRNAPNAPGGSGDRDSPR